MIPSPSPGAGRPLKIVHLITGLNTGGAEMVLLRLVSGTGARLRNVVVSLTDEGDVGPMIRAAGVPVHTLGMRRGMPSPGALLRLVALLRRERPDVLQCWLYHAPRERPDVLQCWLYHADLAGLLAGRVAGVPAVAWNIRSADPATRGGPGGPPLLLRALSALSPWPDAVVVNSRVGWQQHAGLGYRPRAWALIGNGVDVDVFRPSSGARERTRAALGIGEGVPVVGMVARYDPVKDHATFFRAARRLADVRPDAVFVLAGRQVNGANEALRDCVAQSGLGERVRLLGPRTDLPALYPAFDVAALTSVSEGFPNVVVEAMACGVPAVVTDAGDAAEIVGEAGEVVAVGDAEGLAGAWGRVLALSPAERAARGAAARARVADNFSLEATLRSYERLYLQLAGTGRAGARAADATRGPSPEPGTSP